MGVKEITNCKGKTRYVPMFDSPEELNQIMFDDSSQGFCIGCGEEAYGVEPDARRYECESCGQKTVYGLAELLISNCVAFSE